jgi:hypothetical protein
MGYALRYANRVDLANMKPHEELCSSRYCLANPGQQYVVFAPQSVKEILLNQPGPHIAGEVTVDLTAVQVGVMVEWLNTASGEVLVGKTVPGGNKRSFESPFNADSVLYLEAVE